MKYIELSSTEHGPDSSNHRDSAAESTAESGRMGWGTALIRWSSVVLAIGALTSCTASSKGQYRISSEIGSATTGVEAGPGARYVESIDLVPTPASTIYAAPSSDSLVAMASSGVWIAQAQIDPAASGSLKNEAQE